VCGGVGIGKQHPAVCPPRSSDFTAPHAREMLPPPTSSEVSSGGRGPFKPRATQREASPPAFHGKRRLFPVLFFAAQAWRVAKSHTLRFRSRADVSSVLFSEFGFVLLCGSGVWIELEPAGAGRNRGDRRGPSGQGGPVTCRLSRVMCRKPHQSKKGTVGARLLNGMTPVCWCRMKGERGSRGIAWCCG